MLLTVKLMLDWLKETEQATRLESAIARVIAEVELLVLDLGDVGEIDLHLPGQATLGEVLGLP